MSNSENNILKQSGTVLVIALLYLSALTLLVSSTFNMSSLQYKMERHFRDAEIAFQNAESALIKAESEINEITLNGADNLSSDASYQFKRISVQKCGLWFYQINAKGTYLRAVRELESIMLLPVYDDQCPEMIGKKRRILWREL